jgi:hypothetical protein
MRTLAISSFLLPSDNVLIPGPDRVETSRQVSIVNPTVFKPMCPLLKNKVTGVDRCAKDIRRNRETGLSKKVNIILLFTEIKKNRETETVMPGRYYLFNRFIRRAGYIPEIGLRNPFSFIQIQYASLKILFTHEKTNCIFLRRSFVSYNSSATV